MSLRTCPSCGEAKREEDFALNFGARRCRTCVATETAERRSLRAAADRHRIQQQFGLKVSLSGRRFSKLQQSARATAESAIPKARRDRLADWSLVTSRVFGWGAVALFFFGQQFLKDNDINGLAAYGGLLGCAFGFRLFVDWLAAPRTGAIADATGEILRGLVSTAERDQLAALRFYTTPEWRVARLTVIERDGRVCKMCSERIVLSRDVSVDHICPRSRYPELALELTNLQALCRRCNSSKGARV